MTLHTSMSLKHSMSTTCHIGSLSIFGTLLAVLLYSSCNTGVQADGTKRTVQCNVNSYDRNDVQDTFKTHCHPVEPSQDWHAQKALCRVAFDPVLTPPGLTGCSLCTLTKIIIHARGLNLQSQTSCNKNARASSRLTVT